MPPTHFVAVRGLRPFLLAALASVMFVCAARAESSCDDVLGTLHKKPKHLEFQGCEQHTDRQDVFEARYRVAGTHAAAVESFLAREFKVKKLRLHCCLWESGETFYRHKQGRAFTISMSSEETIITRRKQWAKIPYFYVFATWFPPGQP